MGKRKASNQSLVNNSVMSRKKNKLKNKLNTQKCIHQKINSKRKMKNNIQKLFNTIRNRNDSSDISDTTLSYSNCSMNSSRFSIIDLDTPVKAFKHKHDELFTTVDNNLDASGSSSHKSKRRKIGNKVGNLENNLLNTHGFHAKNDFLESKTTDNKSGNDLVISSGSSANSIPDTKSNASKDYAKTENNNNFISNRDIHNIEIIEDSTLYSNEKPLIIDINDVDKAPCSSTPLRTKLKTSSNNKMNNIEGLIQNFNEDVASLTREINGDSYLTIDLTTDSSVVHDNSKVDTVIDLVNISEPQDCAIVSVSNANLSLSGESDVTVVSRRKRKRKNNKRMRRFASGIAKLDASDKGRLLEIITQSIFNGCNVPETVKSRIQLENQPNSRSTETEQDTYIKQVILGQTSSRNSIGSNIYNPEKDSSNKNGLRMVVIDGSNVAMEHGKGRVFSVKGLKICIDYFLRRGHVVKAFVPRFRCKFGKSSEPRLLDNMERQGLVVYTPSREIQGRMVTSYDDRYIVQCAAEFDGVIVSGDNYRDLLQENPRWRSVIENRLLPFTWVQDMIMFPKDPLGRNGPTLEQFLKHNNPNV